MKKQCNNNIFFQLELQNIEANKLIDNLELLAECLLLLGISIEALKEADDKEEHEGSINIANQAGLQCHKFSFQHCTQ